MKITIPQKEEIIKRKRVESDTRPGVYYDVEIWNTGRADCSCPAIKECKHIKRTKKEID